MQARGRLAGLALATVLAHMLALGGLEWGWPAHAMAAAPATVMQVRIMALAPLAVDVGTATAADVRVERAAALTLALEPTPTAALVPVPVPVPVLIATPMPRPVAIATPMPRPVPIATPMPAPKPRRATPTLEPTLVLASLLVPTPAPAPAPRQEEPVTLQAQPLLALLAPVPNAAPAAPSAPAAPPAPHDETIPHYATQMPPPMLLRYEMHRGALRGTGELTWRPQTDRYELRLDARIGPLTLLAQSSAGGFDAAGMAPVRFTDQRMRKAVQAVNFQRDVGKVTFSGPSTEYPLRAGMQDRLSWMVQLAAIISAEPALRATGAKVSVLVVGSQGDASVWAFRCMGVEALQLGAGETRALSYVREPRDPYDTSVKVWLDAARHYLPVRADTKAGPGDPGIGLSLQEMQPLP